MFFDELSPITQRKASTRLDLPQPFGQTNSGEPRLDQKFQRLDKSLEARDAQFGQFHRLRPPCRKSAFGVKRIFWARRRAVKSWFDASLNEASSERLQDTAHLQQNGFSSIVILRGSAALAHGAAERKTGATSGWTGKPIFNEAP
jgi:hypothetical protein